ncbi:TrpB-like pyridoxal phosphate-dependent enzyme [Chloroflexota bacterium]
MKITLESKKLPDKWYNIIPDLDFIPPNMMSSSGYSLSHHDLEALAPSAVVDQELEKEKREIPIPNEVKELYSQWRPTPLYRAEKLEKSLDTPARIFYKYETNNHEANTAMPQAYYASRENVKRIISATGNGEWGISLATACNYFGIQSKVYMVRSSYEEKVYGRYAMEILGAEVISSPNEKTRTGKKVLSQNQQSSGSLSIALSEAFEEASIDDDAKFAWGTVMNHVLLHQTIIGLEARLQMRQAGVKPDIIISAVGGGSAFGGLVFPFYPERSKGMRAIAVETAASPSLSRGRYAYDYADASGLSPLLKMYTLGHGFTPPGIRAGGMRYHGLSPLISALYREKQIEAKAYTQHQAFEAAVTFARTEGMIPSVESSYTIRAVVDEALACKHNKESKNVLFILDANSNLDATSFNDFLLGVLEKQPFPEESLQKSLAELPEIN